MKKLFMITKNNKVVACCANYAEAYEIAIFMAGSSIQEFFLSDNVIDQARKIH